MKYLNHVSESSLAVTTSVLYLIHIVAILHCFSRFDVSLRLKTSKISL